MKKEEVRSTDDSAADSDDDCGGGFGSVISILAPALIACAAILSLLMAYGFIRLLAHCFKLH